MADHPLTYSIELPGFEILVRELRGTERLSAPFALEARFALDPQTMTGLPEAFDPEALVKANATIVMKRGDVVVRRVEGIASKVHLGCSLSGVPEVMVVVEPRLALLRHRADVRIHRDLTVPQIVREVVEALGVQVELRLEGDYPSRPYCVQWRESDLDYVHRLLEDEGIFYFFTAGDVMVLGDNPGAYEPIPGDPTIPYRHEAGANLHHDAIHRIGGRARLTAGKVSLRDWNTEHPRLDMDVSHDCSLAGGLEWYDYPGEYEEPGEGQRKAMLHAQAFDSNAANVSGRTTCGRFYPGAIYQLLEPPPGAEAGRFALRALTHDWHRDQVGWEAAFEAHPEAHVFRPARTTHVPRIFNPHTGIVTVSSPGEDIHCDHFGRVKVHFHWDRLRPYDDDCSHWIPVLQDNTGESSAIPREGWEVMVHFLEGDPDRPVVLGRVYNGEDRFTEKLPKAKTRSGLKSMTTPSRDDFNEIRFEDLAGHEQIYVHAAKDQNIRIANNRHEDIGDSESTIVKHDETIQVGGDADWSIGDRMNPIVQGNETWKVSGNRTKKVGKSDSNAIGGDQKLQIGGNHELEIFCDVGMSAKNIEEKVNGSLLEKYKEKHQTSMGNDLELEVSGSQLELVDVSKGESTTKRRKEEIGGVHLLKAKGEIQWRFDETRRTTVKGSVMVSAPRKFALTGAEKFLTDSASATYVGSTDLTLKVGDNHVLMKDGLIFIKAKQNIDIKIGGSNNAGAAASTQN